MATCLRGSAPWLLLLSACSGAAFKAGEQSGGGQGGSSTATMAGGRSGTSGTPDAGAGGMDTAGESGQPANGGQGGALDDGGSGGEGGSAGAGDAVCALACGKDEECTVTPAGPECRCTGGTVADGGICRLPRSCDELHRYTPSLPSGPYPLKPEGAASSFEGYCGMTQEGGGWTLVVNEGPAFDPTTAGVADALCYSSSCTNIGYSLVLLNSDVMLDVGSSPIAGTTYSARLVVTGVHAMSQGKTLRTLFTTGPNFVEAENNSNLAVRMRDGAECTSLPEDLAKIVCQSCDTADCKEPVMVFGDIDAPVDCHAGGVPHFALGAASDYVTPWTNCAGWPQAPDYAAFEFYPKYVRVWVR